jgi:hypothetical protein
MKRSAIARRISPRLARYNKEFAEAKPLVIERSQGYCEVSRHCRMVIDSLRDNQTEAMTAANAAASMMLSHACEQRGAHVHHRRYRKRGGTNSLNNLIHVCLSCHAWIHAHGGYGEDANILRLALSSHESEKL